MVFANGNTLCLCIIACACGGITHKGNVHAAAAAAGCVRWDVARCMLVLVCVSLIRCRRPPRLSLSSPCPDYVSREYATHGMQHASERNACAGCMRVWEQPTTQSTARVACRTDGHTQHTARGDI